MDKFAITITPEDPKRLTATINGKIVEFVVKEESDQLERALRLCIKESVDCDLCPLETGVTCPIDLKNGDCTEAIYDYYLNKAQEEGGGSK